MVVHDPVRFRDNPAKLEPIVECFMSGPMKNALALRISYHEIAFHAILKHFQEVLL